MSTLCSRTGLDVDEHWRAGLSVTSSSNVSYEHNSTVDLHEQLLLYLIRLPLR